MTKSHLFTGFICGILLLSACSNTNTPTLKNTQPSSSAIVESSAGNLSRSIEAYGQSSSQLKSSSSITSGIGAITSSLSSASSSVADLSAGLTPSSVTLGTRVQLTTSQGVIVIALAEKDTPKTTANFLQLVKKGFYNGLTFHRVVEDFVAQTGDPTGTGRGGSEQTIPLEIPCNNGIMVSGRLPPSECRTKLSHTLGAVGMARTEDPNSASSQFYIVTGEGAEELDGSYTIFGYVVSGMDTARKLQLGDLLDTAEIIP